MLRAYCPTHAGPAHEWAAAEVRWQEARREIGRQAARSVVARFLRLMMPSLGIEIDKAEVGKLVRAWEDANPRPIPPWAR